MVLFQTDLPFIFCDYSVDNIYTESVHLFSLAHSQAKYDNAICCHHITLVNLGIRLKEVFLSKRSVTFHKDATVLGSLIESKF